ncbi:hypothetical protein [Neisseria weixii]|uniref:hypothetical protein n=1 Tax=Neisseria weixii TaxID=1853276 RepID=UPI0035A0E0EC
MEDATQIKNSFIDFVSSALQSLSRRELDGAKKRKIEDVNRILPVLRKIENVEQICPLFVKGNIDFMSHMSSVSEDSIDAIFLTCVSFLGEYIVFLKLKHKELDDRLKKIWGEFKNDTEFECYPIVSSYIHYANYIRNELQFDVLVSYIGGKNFQSFLNYENKVRDSESKLNELESLIRLTHEKAENDLTDREKRVGKLAEKLEEQKTAFNFVGLSQGFQAILTKKNNARHWTFGILCVMLMATLTPVGFSFWKFTQGEELSWQKMLPVIGLEFVLIYFFRVVLSHYNSIQTQIMQLELRQSLCQFIQNYADYAKEMKANDGVSLEKFENLIFSSILSNPDKVPGTFDGIESVTALIKEVRSK